MRRSEARECLMQMIFSMEAQKDFSENAEKLFAEEYVKGSSQTEYFEKVWKAFTENKETIDEIIEQASEKWHIKRMAKVDLAVLRLCVCEMKYLTEEEVPEKVSINEAVNLAKKYGSEDSGKFVNGVLGKISRSSEK